MDMSKAWKNEDGPKKFCICATTQFKKTSATNH